MKKIFLSQSLAKAVSFIYFIMMVVVTYKMFEGYVDPEFPFCGSDMHLIYAAGVGAFGIVFLLNGAASVPYAVQSSMVLISMVGIIISCLYGCFGIWAELGFFVGAFLLFAWKVVISEELSVAGN